MSYDRIVTFLLRRSVRRSKVAEEDNKKAEPELRLRVSLTLNLLHFQRIDNGFCISLRLLLIVGWQGNLQRQQMAVHFTQHD